MGGNSMDSVFAKKRIKTWKLGKENFDFITVDYQVLTENIYN